MLRQQLLNGGFIDRMAIALEPDLAIPVQAVMVQGLQNIGGGAGLLPGRVQILHPYQPAAVVGAGIEKTGQCREQRAQVQGAGGGRGEATDIGGVWHDASE